MSGGFFGGTSSFGQGSQSSPSKNSQARDGKTETRAVRSLMISQLAHATIEGGDGPVLIDGAEAATVVLCLALLHIEDEAQRKLKFSDSTGVVTLQLREQVELTDDMQGHYLNVYGRLRAFNGKVKLDIVRLDKNIAPNAQIYHEITVAREWFHFSGNAPLGTTFGEEGAAPKDETLFVDDNGEITPELRDLIISAIDSINEDSEATVQLIASSINMNEATTKKHLDTLQADGVLYCAVEGVYQVG